MRIGRKLYAKPAEAVCAPGRKSLMNILISIASAVINPPGCAYDAVYVAYNMLQGKEIDPAKLGGQFGNTIYKPLTTIDNSNMAEWLSYCRR